MAKMKHNLKNRPEFGNYSEEHDILWKKQTELYEWFEGFEKELREISDSLIADVNVERTEKELIREQDEFPIEQREQAVFDAGYCKGIFDKIKEVLGE